MDAFLDKFKKKIKRNGSRSTSLRRTPSLEKHRPATITERWSASTQEPIETTAENGETVEVGNGPLSATLENQDRDPMPNADEMETGVASRYPERLRERLWNQAYDGLKADEPGIVDAFEKLLSTELQNKSRDTPPSANIISSTADERRPQMESLVQVGLDRTAKEVAIKEKVSVGIQTVTMVKRAMDKAVQAAPQAAIAWVGVCFVLEVLSNPLTEPGINREGVTYVVSRMDWYWNLVDLLLDKGASPPLAELRDQLEKHVVQLYQKLLLYQMKSVCLYHRSRVATFFRDVIKLDNWRGQLDDIKAAEADVQSDSGQYGSLQARTHLQDIASAIHRQEQVHYDEEDKKCLNDLYETDPSHDKTRIEDTKGGLLRGSYAWILENLDFKQWRTDPESRLFWIKGDPGKGKTMLLCGIIDELDKDPIHRPSFFFCQATEQRLNNATAVLRGLIYSLARRYPSLISHVRKEYDGGGGKQRFEGNNARQVMDTILMAMLKDPILGSAVLIVDALDECDAGRTQLLDFIIRASAISPAKWIVSSRNWPDIEDRLGIAAEKVTLCLELNEDSIADAVHAYIRYKVDELARLKTYDEETRHIVSQHFTNKSNNTFLWVALVFQELAAPDVQSWEALDILETLPSGLESLYERMMERITKSRHKSLCRQILAVATVVYRPITLKEMTSTVQSLARFTDNLVALRKLVAFCGSFLTVRNDTIYFLHQSAKDFLLEKASDEILPRGIADQHYEIFRGSLTALSSTLRRDMYDLQHPGVSIDDISPPDPNPLAPVSYACIHWVDHLRGSGRAEDQTAQVVYDFLKVKYLYWLESLSLLRSMSTAILAIQNLELFMGREVDRELIELLHDARRFTLSHKAIAEIAPLQLYASALIFSPTKSLLRNIFQDEASQLIKRFPVTEADWSPCLQTLEPHDHSTYSVALSADGQRLASGSYYGTVNVWDRLGTCIHILKGHSDSIHGLAFSADSQRLASGSDDGTIKVWDESGACIQTLDGHKDWVMSVAFSADSQRLVSGSRDGIIKVWDASGACIQTLDGHTDGIASVIFFADDQRLISWSKDRTVKVWDATGACIQTLEGYKGSSSVAFSADGQRLASGSRDGTVRVWDAAGACIQTLEGKKGDLSSVAFSADGDRLASGSEDDTVRVWDVSTGACVQTLHGHHFSVRSMAFSADGQQLVSGARGGTVKIWDVATGADTQETPHAHRGFVQFLSFLGDGESLLSGSRDNDTMKIWNVATRAQMQTFDDCVAWYSSTASSVDGQWLASGLNDERTVKVWEATTGTCIQTLEYPSCNDADCNWFNDVKPVTFSANGQWLAVRSCSCTITIWDVATGACLRTIETQSDADTLAFSADGQRLASGSRNIIKIWDVATGVCIQVLKGSLDQIENVAFSADGLWLASASFESIEIWQLMMGACVQTLSVRRGVRRLSFDGTSNTRLSTNVGTLALDLSSIGKQPLASSVQEPLYYGYGIEQNGAWIIKGSEKWLWLPTEYRPNVVDVFGSTVAVGCASGRVFTIQFIYNDN